MGTTNIFWIYWILNADRLTKLFSLFIFWIYGVLNADEVLNHIAFAPVGNVVAGAASGCSVGTAGFANLQM